MSFDDDTRLRPAADGAFEGAIGEGWWTPRGPLGGYVMAIMMRALMLAVDDDQRQPRSLTVSFLRPPEAGPVLSRPVVERSGRSVSTGSVRLEQEDKLLAIGLATFSGPWPGPRLDDAPMPEVAPPGEREAPARELPGQGRPTFLDRLTMQRRFGELPFTSAEHAETGGWLGLLEQRPVDALTVLVLADAWFPAPWPRLTELAPAPTIEMTVYFRAPLPLPDSVLLGRFRTGLARDGFFDEDGELWTSEGTLIAQSRQLALLLGAPPGDPAEPASG
jgi:acyl-CoA thioesterase